MRIKYFNKIVNNVNFNYVNSIAAGVVFKLNYARINGLIHVTECSAQFNVNE